MKRRREIKQSTDILPLAHNLERIVEQTATLPQVRKVDLQFGDLVLVTTRNSVYSIYTLDEGLYLISGGWFDRKGLSPAKITIAGCTFGGRIIKSDIVAGCGLRLEFGNRVVTTPIRKVCVVRLGSQD
ncbi:MAG: hypothetical protein GTN65_06125 [Armatimonadetes bacterium]|nr:hypothetical protein [Armatimonadota bacterium]NIO96668.1 hypothetical protein [Armatimonadota bacterium]